MKTSLIAQESDFPPLKKGGRGDFRGIGFQTFLSPLWKRGGASDLVRERRQGSCDVHVNPPLRKGGTGPGFRCFVWRVLLGLSLLAGGEAGAETDPLLANLHVFQPPAAAPASPIRVSVPLDEESQALEMTVFIPNAVSGAAYHRPPHPVAEARRPGSLGRKGSPLYGYQADAFFHTAYRQDNFDWNIAAPGGSPNVLSELQWENLHIAQLKGDFSLVSPSGWQLQGRAGYGWILEGENQDSDYWGDDRTLEFSRSNNQADRGHVFDASLGFGYRLGLGGDVGKPWLGLTPLAGYSYHEQSLRMHDGLQTLSEPVPGIGFLTPPAGTRFDDLNSRYETQWHGPWLGLGLRASLWERIDLFGEVVHHWADYHAQANWNLRDDFKHPKSFVHDADGSGITALAGARYRTAAGWAVQVVADYQRWQAEAGKSTFYLASGGTPSEPLNEVNWESFGVGVGVGYSFW